MSWSYAQQHRTVDLRPALAGPVARVLSPPYHCHTAAETPRLFFSSAPPASRRLFLLHLCFWCLSPFPTLHGGKRRDTEHFGTEWNTFSRPGACWRPGVGHFATKCDTFCRPGDCYRGAGRRKTRNSTERQPIASWVPAKNVQDCARLCILAGFGPCAAANEAFLRWKDVYRNRLSPMGYVAPWGAMAADRLA